jgi:hypothetical protein
MAGLRHVPARIRRYATVRAIAGSMESGSIDDSLMIQRSTDPCLFD